jgi:hypothetical protein
MSQPHPIRAQIQEAIRLSYATPAVFSQASRLTNITDHLTQLVESNWTPPEDPLLLLARELVAARHPSEPHYQSTILKGEEDNHPALQNALAAVKAGVKYALAATADR